MRRLLLIAIPIAVVLALAGLPSQHADGYVAVPRQLGPAARILPRLTVAHAAAPQRAPLRFTLVDVAGAAVHRWPGGPVSGSIAATTPLGSHSWAWALASTRNHRWAHVVLTWKPNGRTGWVRLAGRRRVHVAYWVKADLSQRLLWLMRGRHPLVAFRAADRHPLHPHSHRQVLRHRPGRHRRSRPARSAGSPSACPATSPTCPQAGAAATSSPSTAPTNQARSARPRRPAACASPPRRSRGCAGTCASAPRSLSSD